MKLKFYLLAFAMMVGAIGAEAQVKINPNVQESRVKFFTNFESGSLDSVSMKEMMMVCPQMEKEYEKIVFDVYSRFDPKNPADPTLPPTIMANANK